MKRLLLFFVSIFIPFLCFAQETGTLSLRKQNIDTSKFSGEDIVVTEHYDISAGRRENAVRIGEQLEHLYNAWIPLFDYFPKSGKFRPNDQSLRIHLYPNKKEYVQHLLIRDTGIAQSNGYYDAQQKTAYFYSIETNILNHEGTHQLLAQQFCGDKIPDFPNNFWAVEGIALFMETLKIEENCYSAGDFMADRLFSAKIYRFERNHNLPIEELAALSAAEVHARSDLQQIYSQSSALVHWLMFADEGIHRKALFNLIQQTYQGTAKPETLSRLTGLSFSELDKKYEEFLKTIPE